MATFKVSMCSLNGMSNCGYANTGGFTKWPFKVSRPASIAGSTEILMPFSGSVGGGALRSRNIDVSPVVV